MMNRAYRSFVPFLDVSTMFMAGGGIPRVAARQASLPADVASRSNQLNGQVTNLRPVRIPD